MQPRLCPGQPSGVVVGLLIHPAPGKHPETARPLAPCSEETETRRYLTAALARPMANPTGYKAALAGVSPRPPRHVSPPPPPPPTPPPTRTVGPSQPRLEPAGLWPRLPKRRALQSRHYPWSWVPIPKTEVGVLRKTPKETGGQDCAGVVAGAPFVTATLPRLVSGYLLCAVCLD